jgi:hypothetical protein
MQLTTIHKLQMNIFTNWKKVQNNALCQSLTNSTGYLYIYEHKVNGKCTITVPYVLLSVWRNHYTLEIYFLRKFPPVLSLNNLCSTLRTGRTLKRVKN